MFGLSVIPETIGRYRLEGELGRGAMGQVFLAHDPNIGRRLAIKVIPFDPRNTELRARFQREAQAAGRLNHPNIVTIYDAGEDSGILYLAMELVEGQSLGEVLERGPLSVAQAVSVGLQVASGLEQAHAQSIVHRDIKPSNIMIAGATAKVMDFGVARLAGAGLTTTGQTPGTPAYLPPEVIRGEPADARSDIFSLGVVLYECLSGKRLFDGDNISTVMYQVLNVQPPAPAAAIPGVPDSLSGVILKAIEKQPEARYQNCAELCTALEACRAQASISAATADVSIAVTPAVPRPISRGSASTAASQSGGTSTATQAIPQVPPPVAQDGIPAPRRSAGAGARVAAGVAFAVVLLAFGFFRQRQQPAPSASGAGTATNADGRSTASAPPRVPGRASQTPARSSAAAAAPPPADSAPVEDARPPAFSETVSPPPPQDVPELRATATAGVLQIQSTPPGARIKINDADTGKVTPANVALEPGKHKVRLETDGFPAQNRDVEIAAGENFLLHVEMKRRGLLRRMNPF